MVAIARTRLKRKLFDDKESAFRVSKQPVKDVNIDRFLKRKNISADALLSSESPVNGERLFKPRFRKPLILASSSIPSFQRIHTTPINSRPECRHSTCFEQSGHVLSIQIIIQHSIAAPITCSSFPYSLIFVD